MNSKKLSHECSIAELTDFVGRLTEFNAVRKCDARRSFEHQWQRIRSQFPQVLEEAKAYEAKTSPRFNIFQILRLERKEVLVHTPLLAELLDPNGIHGQGFLFLNGFLSLLLKHRAKMPTLTHQHHWFVEAEKPTGTHGNLDILLTCFEQGFRLAIENKIGATERADQIWDYSCWLREGQRRFPQQYLVFLTPDGRKPYSARTADCISLSYHRDIHDWFTATLTQVQSPAVRELVTQYIQIIENC